MRGQAWFQLPSINSNLFVLKKSLTIKKNDLYIIYFGIWSCGFPKKNVNDKKGKDSSTDFVKYS